MANENQFQNYLFRDADPGALFFRHLFSSFSSNRCMAIYPKPNKYRYLVSFVISSQVFCLLVLKPAFGLIRKRNFRRTLEVPRELYPPCQIFVRIIRIELFLRCLILPLILPFCRYVLVFCLGVGFLGIHFKVFVEMNGRRGSALRGRRMRDRSAT
jgi:hypothetical protein